MNEAWITNTEVNFCARAYPTVPVRPRGRRGVDRARPLPAQRLFAPGDPRARRGLRFRRRLRRRYRGLQVLSPIVTRGSSKPWKLSMPRWNGCTGMATATRSSKKRSWGSSLRSIARARRPARRFEPLPPGFSDARPSIGGACGNGFSESRSRIYNAWRKPISSRSGASTAIVTSSASLAPVRGLESRNPCALGKIQRRRVRESFQRHALG